MRGGRQGVQGSGRDTLCQLDDAGYRAVVAGSVLNDLLTPRLADELRLVIVPGGGLALSEMPWSPGCEPAATSRLSDESQEVFGIRMAPRQATFWDDWGLMLEGAGFRIERTLALGPDLVGALSRPRLPARLGRAMIHPRAVLDLWRLRRRALRFRVPEGWLERTPVLAVRDLD